MILYLVFRDGRACFCRGSATLFTMAGHTRKERLAAHAMLDWLWST